MYVYWVTMHEVLLIPLPVHYMSLVDLEVHGVVGLGHTNMRTHLLKYFDSAIYLELIPGGHATYPILSV